MVDQIFHPKKPWQLLIFLLFNVVFPNVLLAASVQPFIKLTLDTDDVYDGDHVVLEIESTGLFDPIDLSVLSNDLEFVRETTGTMIEVINGKVVEIALRRMEFTPRRTGIIVLGPLSAEEVLSNSVALKVRDAVRSEWKPAHDDIVIEMSLSTIEPYVQQQVVFDLRLLHRYSVADESIELPEFDGFAVKPIFAERRTWVDESREQRSIAWRWLLFAEQSGDHLIRAPRWNGTIVKSRPERAQFKRTTESLSLSVQPAVTSPAENVVAWWLPTKRLEMTEAWSTEVTSLRAGDEVTRTIIVTAEEVLPGQLPTPTILESRAITQTLIASDRKAVIDGDTVRSTAAFTYRVKALSPIPVFLDTIRLSWWNTETEEAVEAIIPARRINVGLPDRADLLKNIALEESGTSIVKHWLATAGGLRLTLHLTAIVVGLVALAALLMSFRTEFLLWHRSRQQRIRLVKLCSQDRWPELYATLGRISVNAQDAVTVDGIRERLAQWLYASKTPDKQAESPLSSKDRKQLAKLSVVGWGIS